MSLPLSGRRGGFTLIELLVVITIIAILASVLLPAMGTAKVRSQGIRCLQNLRNLQLAWGMYADDSDGQLVWNPDGSDSGKVWGKPSWAGGWLDFTTSPDNTNTELLVSYGSRAGRYGGLLGPYVGKNFKVFKCPADRAAVTILGRPLPRVRSNSMNTYMNGARADNGQLNRWSSKDFKTYKKMSDFTKPSPANTFVFLDEREDSINDSSFSVNLLADLDQNNNLTPETFMMVDFPASYHNRAAGFTFADGHAEIHKWQDTRTIPGVRSEAQINSVPIYPSNPDVGWLAERASSRK